MNTEAPAGYADSTFADRLAAHLDEHAARQRPAPDAEPVEADEPDAADTDILQALTTELRAESTWSGPPATLRDAMLARVRATAAPAPEPATLTIAATEAAIETPGPVETPKAVELPKPVETPKTVEAPKPSRSWWRSRWGRLTWAVPAVALSAALFTGGVLYVDRALNPTREGTSYSAVGTSLAPGATATVRIGQSGSGFWVEADFTNLPAAAPGSYYSAWLRGPAGVVPLGSFHERRTGTPVQLWSGVDPKQYPTFEVTLQAEGDPPVPSPLVVLTAAVGGA